MAISLMAWERKGHENKIFIFVSGNILDQMHFCWWNASRKPQLIGKYKHSRIKFLASSTLQGAHEWLNYCLGETVCWIGLATGMVGAKYLGDVLLQTDSAYGVLQGLPPEWDTWRKAIRSITSCHLWVTDNRNKLFLLQLQRWANFDS